MNVQANSSVKLTGLFETIRETERRISILRRGYSQELERYTEKVEYLAELHRALHQQVNRNVLGKVAEQERRQAIIELQLEIENFTMPAAPDPSFFMTELNRLEATLREHSRHLRGALVLAAVAQVN